MLKNLLVKNFKSYKFVKIDLHPGVNVFFGESNEGKTNLLRAIKLLTQNRPTRVNYFPNFGGVRGTTKIRGTFREDDDKHDTVVELQKKIRIDKNGKKKLVSHQYSVNPGNFTYDGFKTTVPDKVIDAINLNDLNFQSQLDSSFILTSSGGKIANAINEITGLENVHSWQSTADSLIKESTRKIEKLKADKKTYEDRISSLSELAMLKSKIKKLNVLHVKCDELDDDIFSIEEATRAITLIDKRLLKLRPATKVLTKKMKKLEAIKLGDMNKTIQTLTTFINTNEQLEEQRIEKKVQIDEYEHLLRKLKVCPACGSSVKDVNKLLEEI